MQHILSFPDIEFDPNSNIPIYIINCGFYKNVSRPISVSRPEGRLDYQLLLPLSGTMLIDKKEVSAGNIFLYCPRSPQNYTYYEAGSENKIAVSGSNGVILPYTEPGLEIGNLTCKNILKNHNFNTEITNPVSFGWNTNLTGNYRVVQYDPPEKMPGYCAAYLLSLSGEVTRVWWAYPIAEVISTIVVLLLFARIYQKKIKPLMA